MITTNSSQFSKICYHNDTVLNGTIIAFKRKSPPFVFQAEVNARERLTISHHMEIEATVQDTRKETVKL
jgi:hypothetical protein